jgi:DnaJ-class molecular chaperone
LLQLEEAYTGVHNKSVRPASFCVRSVSVLKSKQVRFQRHILCPRCRGSGADTPGDVMGCPHCLGRGQVKVMHMFPFGPAAVMQTYVFALCVLAWEGSLASRCQHCRGTGQLVTRLCTRCQGHGRVSHAEETYFSVPRGVEEYYQIVGLLVGANEFSRYAADRAQLGT